VQTQSLNPQNGLAIPQPGRLNLHRFSAISRPIAAWTRTEIDTIGAHRSTICGSGLKVEYDVSGTLASSYVAIKETLGGQSCNRTGS